MVMASLNEIPDMHISVTIDNTTDTDEASSSGLSFMTNARHAVPRINHGG